MTQQRETGTVKWFDPDRGFGFISRDGRSGDIYVNIDDVQRAGMGTLEPRDKVSYTVGKSPKGKRAENLKLEEAGTFRFDETYLQDGYFETAVGDTNDLVTYLRPEVVDSLAMKVAETFANPSLKPDMKPNQIRRFFNKARGIESKLDRVKNFDAVKADVLSLKRDVVYQAGRDLVPDVFRQFIERNADLAAQDEQSFRRGFLQHFESVLAYFVYYHKQSGRR